jgi:site-specific recombinase XerD
LNSKLLGQFEALVASSARSKHTFRRYCEILEHFFDCFPRKRRPEQFHITDIEDYKVQRRERGISPATLTLELAVVRAFFNGYLERYALDWTNPAGTRRSKYS